MPERLDTLAPRLLTTRSLSALGLIALLTVLAQVLIQRHLQQSHDDAQVMNLAGRQRMLSQELVKAALAWQLSAPGPDRVAYQDEIRRVLATWNAADAWLEHGTTHAGIGVNNSRPVAAAFERLQPDASAMRTAAARLDRDPSAMATLLRSEPTYLSTMESIVSLYGTEAAGRVHRTALLVAGLCLLLLVVLLAEALLVFRPAIIWLRQALADQARLRDQEMLQRELSVAAEVARDIGFDLHDGVGQSLTALSLQARHIEMRMGDHVMASAVASVRQGLADGLTQIRAAARRLAPIDIHVIGLEGALRDLAKSTHSVAGVDCQVDWSLHGAWSGAEDLYRIAQEAVTNALRHGRARKVSISVRAQDTGGILVVRDDGTGAPSTSGVGVGLRSMRYRAERIGGSIRVGSQPGGGWQVECRFPLRPVRRA